MSDDDIEFQILVYPNELESIDGIWNIAIDSTDYKVIEKTTNFLIKLYTSVTFRLEHLIPKFEEEFLRKCIENINRL